MDIATVIGHTGFSGPNRLVDEQRGRHRRLYRRHLNRDRVGRLVTGVTDAISLKRLYRDVVEGRDENHPGRSGTNLLT